MSMNANFYEQDFHAWAMRNAELIRQGKFSEIDAEHVLMPSTLRKSWNAWVKTNGGN